MRQCILKDSVWIADKADNSVVLVWPQVSFLWDNYAQGFNMSEVSSFSGCLGWAALIYCGTP